MRTGVMMQTTYLEHRWLCRLMRLQHLPTPLEDDQTQGSMGKPMR
jgi:hypothetical protein